LCKFAGRFAVNMKLNPLNQDINEIEAERMNAIGHTEEAQLHEAAEITIY